MFVCFFCYVCQNIEWKEGSFSTKRKISSKQELYLRKKTLLINDYHSVCHFGLCVLNKMSTNNIIHDKQEEIQFNYNKNTIIQYLLITKCK